jgi:hypothetical protein
VSGHVPKPIAGTILPSSRRNVRVVSIGARASLRRSAARARPRLSARGSTAGGTRAQAPTISGSGTGRPRAVTSSISRCWSVPRSPRGPAETPSASNCGCRLIRHSDIQRSDPVSLYVSVAGSGRPAPTKAAGSPRPISMSAPLRRNTSVMTCAASRQSGRSRHSSRKERTVTSRNAITPARPDEP